MVTQAGFTLYMYFYIIFVRSTFEDWRLILGSLLQPIPFPNE